MPNDYVIDWDEESGMYGIYEWCDVSGKIGDALDHADTIEEANNRIKELKES